MTGTGRSSELLRKASDLVSGDRQKDYGDKLHNHKNIADLWSAYLDTSISPHDVAVMMCLLKIARLNIPGCISLHGNSKRDTGENRWRG